MVQLMTPIEHRWVRMRDLSFFEYPFWIALIPWVLSKQQRIGIVMPNISVRRDCIGSPTWRNAVDAPTVSDSALDEDVAV